MKISPDKEMGLNFPAWFQKKVMVERSNEIMANKETPDFQKKKAVQEIIDVVSDERNKYYLFTDAAYKISQSLKFDAEKFEANFLSIIPDGKKITYLMGDFFYRWHKQGNRVMVFGCHQKELTPEIIDYYKTQLKRDIEYDVKWYFFAVNLDDSTYAIPPKPVEPFTDDTWIEFIKMLIFTELSELETVVLEPNQKTGTRKKGNFLNGSKSRVIIVDSAWSKTLIKSDGFLVSGHCRLQRYGVGNKLAKYIWIDTFEKEGYIRTSKMLKNK